MSKGLLLVRPVARAADGLVHNGDRRRRIRRFHRVTRVALVPVPPEEAERSEGARSAADSRP